LALTLEREIELEHQHEDEKVQTVIALREAVYARNQGGVADRISLAKSYALAGTVASADGDIVGNFTYTLKARRALEDLQAANPANREINSSLAYVYEQLGDDLLFRLGRKVSERIGRPETAFEFYNKSLLFHRRAAAVFEELSAADGTNATFRRNFAAKTYKVVWAYVFLKILEED